MKKYRIGFIICGVVMAVLLVVIALMSVQLWQVHRQQRYYEKKCTAFAVHNQNASEGQIVFIGDSITDLCKLDDYYGDLPLAVYNRGIGGDTTSGLLARLDVSLLQIKPAQVVVMIGTNDINGGADLQSILANYEQILTSITASLPDTEVFVMSVIPQNHDIEKNSAIDVEKTVPKIMALNVALAQLTHDYDTVTYVDVFSSLEDNAHFLKSEYSDDGLHLNENGFAVWANVLIPYLKGQL